MRSRESQASGSKGQTMTLLNGRGGARVLENISTYNIGSRSRTRVVCACSLRHRCFSFKTNNQNKKNTRCTGRGRKRTVEACLCASVHRPRPAAGVLL